MRWVMCRSCHGFRAVDEGAREMDKTSPMSFPCKCDDKEEVIPRGPLVSGDLKPYVNAIDWTEVSGRREHREFLRRNNVVENPDPPAWLKERLYEAKHGVKHG